MISKEKHQLGRLIAPSILTSGALAVAAAITVIAVSGWPRWALLGLLAAAALSMLWSRRRPQPDLEPISEVLRSADAKQLDLSREIPASKNPALTRFIDDFNRFRQRLREVFEELREHSLTVGLAASQGRILTEKANRDAGRQEQHSQLVFQSSEEASNALGEVSRRTQAVADLNSRNLEAARTSTHELEAVSTRIQGVVDIMRDFEEGVEQLNKGAEEVGAILGTVQGFATQTNMLALNAAIEASRAGEHGRGFAVVADEVRELAGKVGAAAEQISELVENMGNAVQRTANSANEVIANAESTSAAVIATSDRFTRMLGDFQSAHEDLLQVGSAIEQLTTANEERHARNMEIRDLAGRIRADMQTSFQHADTQRDTTNRSLQGLSRFRLGRGHLEKITDLLLTRRDAFQAAMERLVDEGVDMFTRDYQPHPASGDHFEIAYLQPLRDACQEMVDRFTEEDQKRVLFYSIADDHGYTALTLKGSSQPPTGDPKVDALASQAMRFTVDNEVELDNLRKATFVSMGSFVLPGGIIVFAIFAPIELHGRRWGTITAGVLPQVFGLNVK